MNRIDPEEDRKADREVETGNQIRCRRCGEFTRIFVTEVNYTNWPLIFFFGLWAILFPPIKSKEFFCEHCQKTFPPSPPSMTSGEKVVKVILGGLTLIFCGGIAYLIIQAIRSA
jgi:hypothetical protein